MKSIRSSGVGNCLFLCARGWGIDLQERKKLQIPGSVPRRDMVTSKIEPCINTSVTGLNKYSGDWIE